MPIASAALAMVLAVYMPPPHAFARADRSLHGIDLVAGDEAAGAGSDGLEGVDDRDVLVAQASGQDRPA